MADDVPHRHALAPYPHAATDAQATFTREDEDGRVVDRLAFVGWCALAGILAGLLGGLLWVYLAEPPIVPPSAEGSFPGERELDQQTEVTMWFLAVGVVGGLIAGLLAGWRGHRHGWVSVIGVLVLGAVAAAATYRSGVLFHPDPEVLGGLVTSGIVIDSWVVALGWPIGGLIGALGAIFGWRKEQKSLRVAPESSSVLPGR